MTAIYTWDVFSTLDGYGSYGPDGDWGGYWGRQGPDFRENAEIMTYGVDPNTLDEWNVLTMRMPATVISSTLHDTLGWPDATIRTGDAVDIVRRLKEEADVPLRSQASLSLNRALLDAGLVDRIELTLFSVISGLTGTSPVLQGTGDFDLELLESRTLDGRTQLLVYAPTRH